DVPQVIGFVFGHRYAEDEDLIGRDQNAHSHQQGDKDFQMQGKRAHVGYSAEFASEVQPGLPAAYLRLGSTTASRRFSASEPISSGNWKALRSVRFTSMVRMALPMHTGSSITGRAV